MWVDEAEPVSEVAWQKAIPTVREEGAEIGVTWNPERRASATNQRFRVNPPLNSKIVEVNYKDNPWFPTVLEQIRKEDERVRPEQYAHVWLGDYATAHVGAYFAKHLNEAKEEGRITLGNKRPATADQGVLRSWRHRSKKQMPLPCGSASLLRHRNPRPGLLRGRPENHWRYTFSGYETASGQNRGSSLPHDGASHDMVYDVSFESAFRSAGFRNGTISDQGRGAARARIEAARRLFPSVWFNQETTEAGRDALGWYHEKKSEDVRDVGLGPEHDWASHGSDAFGLMAVAYEMPRSRPQKLKYQQMGIV